MTSLVLREVVWFGFGIGVRLDVGTMAVGRALRMLEAAPGNATYETAQTGSVCLIIVCPRSSIHRSRCLARTERATRSEAVLSWSVMM